MPVVGTCWNSGTLIKSSGQQPGGDLPLPGRFPTASGGVRGGRCAGPGPAAPGPPALPARWEPRSALPAPSGGRGPSPSPARHRVGTAAPPGSCRSGGESELSPENI